MIEVYLNLYVGNETDYEAQVNGKNGWRTVQACKEPYHRRALGYTGRGAPKYHPEYLIAPRGNRLVLNLVDAPDPAYIPKETIDAALAFIHEGLEAGDSVLVHCNEGMSRSAGIALLYLAVYTNELPADFAGAEAAFRKLYPMHSPGAGIRGYLQQNWSEYQRRREAPLQEY